MPAYNNYFPVGYPYSQGFAQPMQQSVQPQYPQIQQNPQIPQIPQQPQVQHSGMLWVSNEIEAQNYPVAPNNAVALWDSSKSSVYIKQADASGKPLMKIYDLVERSAVPQKKEELVQNDFGDFVKKDEFLAIEDVIESLKLDMKNLKKEIARKRKEAVEDDE